MNALPSKTLFVYTSSRALKAAVQRESGGVLAPRITLAEFYEKAIFVPGLANCGEMDRVLFMKEAASLGAGERLKFPLEFYEFMKNRSYLFSFFKELAAERLSVDALDLSDTYAWYVEHFEILRELLERYSQLLRSHGFYDEITAPQSYRLNEAYLRGFERIEIDIDGNPSAFEFEILKGAAALSTLVLNFKSTKLNSKPVRAISEICGIEFEPGKRYSVNLSSREILREEALGAGGEIVYRCFELRSLQAGYVFEKISSFVRAGIAPERIVVILPDESFADTLRLYDERIAKAHGSHRMLNFAMGRSVKDSLFYVTLEKISQCLKEGLAPKFGVDYGVKAAENFIRAGGENFSSDAAASPELLDMARDARDLEAGGCGARNFKTSGENSEQSGEGGAQNFKSNGENFRSNDESGDKNFKADSESLSKNSRQNERPKPAELDLFFSLIGLESELFKEFELNFNNPQSFESFEALIRKILNLPKIYDAVLEAKIKEPLYLIEILLRKLRGESLSLSNLIDLFLLELGGLKLDDVSGGKVTAMGLLESRGLQFDGVIIIDFNDDLVPKRVENEMFLNAALRARAGLISHADRENLQRFYYASLILGAKKTAISYLQNSEKSPSRFLKSFDAALDCEFSQEDYLRLFGERRFLPALRGQDDPILRHDFFKNPLSFSRLDSFLACKRQYFYKYIAALAEGLSFGEDGALRGTILHSSFELFYYAAGVKFNFDKFSKIYSAIAADAGLGRFDAELELQKIKKIAPLLQQHERTWSFTCGEQRCEGEFEGVRLSGRIDRIDEDGRGGKFIIDYKSSSAKPQSFQLSFYQALLGCECESAYLTLGDEGFVRPGAKTPTLQALREKLGALKEEFAHEVVFTRTDEPKTCEYCAYKIICKGRIDGKI